jgi:isoquinoline 1-oxidoreductase beta subunit
LRIFSAAELVFGHAALVDAAAELPVPQDVPLKGPKDFTLIGTPARRLATVPKTDGTAVCAA